MLQALAKCTGKWCMHVSTEPADYWVMGADKFNEHIAEICKAAPYLSTVETPNIIFDGYGFLSFDSEDECNHHFDLTVGDDGPTVLNTYNGEVRVYAMTCAPNGDLMNENT